MDYKVISPENPDILPCKMLKFFIITDDATVSFIVEDKFWEELFRETFKDLSKEDLDEITEFVKTYYSEDEIGQGELSKVTNVAEIQRFLSSQS